jgi:hypothetical protein
MSLFGNAGAGGGLFPRASEASLQNEPRPAARPAYTAVEPKDEASRIQAQIGPTERAVAWGFAARGGPQPADTTGPGAPRDGAGVR